MKYFKDGLPNPEWAAKRDAIREILTSEGRSLAQGALAWNWARSEKTLPIPGFRTVPQVQENAGAMQFGPLTPAQMSEIDTVTGEGLNILMTEPIYLVAGARPNFIKLAPLVWELQSRQSVPFQIVHTGQHYDRAMSQTFFDVLNIPEPEINLEVGSGTQSFQTARILERFDGLLQEKPPSAVVVFGDVNSTLACSLAAAKRQIPVVHVEAGLRSFDRSMPEEINRLVTDALSDLLLVSENSGMLHLQQEGIPDEKVRLVGNIMIDSLVRMQPKALERQTAARLGVEPGAICTADSAPPFQRG